MSIFARPHRCDVRPSAVQHRQAAIFAPWSTLILYRCECSSVEVVEVAGKWTLPQIRGGAPAPLEAADADTKAGG